MLTQSRIASELFSEPRKVWIQPALAGTATDCLIFLDAEFYIEQVQAPKIIEDLQTAGDFPSVTAIYLSHVDIMARATDFICNEAFSSFVAMDLCRWIEQTQGRHERFFLCGLSLSGLAAMFTALRHPTTFSGVLSQSPSAWWNDEWLAESLPPDGKSSSRFWVSVGDHELQENVTHSPIGLFQKTSQLDSVRRLSRKLNGLCQELHHEEFPGGHDMACWAKELPRALRWLIPKI